MIETKHKEEEALQLNMTPMIDMVFLLIIFFLTATTFTQKEREQEVLLPTTSGDVGSLSKALSRNLIINVKKDGGVFVAGKKYAEDDLLLIISAQNAQLNNALKVKIRADKRTRYGNVARILAIVDKAGVSRPYVDTKEDFLDP